MAMIKTYNGGIQLLGTTDIATYPIQPSDSRQDYHHAYSGKYSNFSSSDLEAAQIDAANKLKALNDAKNDLAVKKESLLKCRAIDLKFGQTRDGQCRKQIGFTEDSLIQFVKEQEAIVQRLQQEYDSAAALVREIEEALAINTNLALDTAAAQTEVAKATQEVSEARQKKATNYAIYVGIALAVIVVVIFIARGKK